MASTLLARNDANCVKPICCAINFVSDFTVALVRLRASLRANVRAHLTSHIGRVEQRMKGRIAGEDIASLDGIEIFSNANKSSFC